ncbi:hypothetical protein BJ742DRAFT_807626 [Cladochytrium replicatum]|nr:hypothetical protein BJ742DRAFT_807626 [Cladochytrium replicatum]
MATEKHSSISSSYAGVISATNGIEFPPSYESAAASTISYESPTIPPSNDGFLVVYPRESVESVDSTSRLIPAGEIGGPIGYSNGIYSVSGITEDEQQAVHRILAAILGTVIIASGVDLAWSTFMFSYVVTTWATSVGLMLLPIFGVPLYFLSSITWRGLAHVDLIFSTLLYPTNEPLNPFVPPPVLLSPALQEHIIGAPSAEALRNEPAPEVELNWETARLTMLATSTWRAVLYFVIPRFLLSVFAIVVFWGVIFPYWLVFGAICGGFAWTPGKVVWPMVKLMSAFPKLAVSQVPERRF